MKLDLIFGVAGARSEFINGWLSSLSDYNSTFRWEIDELTGKSFIDPTLMQFCNTKTCNLISECEKFFNKFNYDVNKIFSSAYHPHFLNNHITEDDLKNHDFRFISITQKKESKCKIFWECIIKNYFPYSKNITEEHLNSSEYMFNNIKNCYNNGRWVDEGIKKWDNLSLPLIKIEYEEIIKPSGSYYLQEKLNLTVTEKDHKYWEEQLRKSHSPLEVECFGKVFKYEDLLC